MHPTVDEQLRGIGRLLEQVAAGGGLAPASADALDEARRRLRRLEGSWAQLLPFLTADNRATAELLAELAPLVAGALAHEVAAAAAHEAERAPTPAATLDVAAVAARNDELRALLATVIAALPGGDAGRAARLAVVAHARRRLDADPLNARGPRPAPSGG